MEHVDERELVILTVSLEGWFFDVNDDIKLLITEYLFGSDEGTMTEALIYLVNLLDTRNTTVPHSVAVDIAEREFISHSQGLIDMLYEAEEDENYFDDNYDTHMAEALSENFGHIQRAMRILTTDLYNELGNYIKQLQLTDNNHITCMEVVNLDNPKNPFGIGYYCRILVDLDRLPF